MEYSNSEVRTVTVRVLTDKPVRKTPYQVKGVFMRQYPDLEVISMMDGTYRDQFLYPRVQVKILNEQIYIIGIHEGVDPVIEMADRLDILDFGNITFQVFDTEVSSNADHFRQVDRLVRYRFLTPWVALNQTTGSRYRFLNNTERLSFLNRLLGQNIVFLAREMGVELNDKIFTKVNLTSLFPKPVDERFWGAFSGEFRTNFLLPNYMGIGNGITRGYGALYGMFNPKSFQFNLEELDEKMEEKDTKEKMAYAESELEGVSMKDVPKPRRNRLKKETTEKKLDKKSEKKTEKKTEKKPKKLPVKKSSKKVLTEEFDIEEDDSFSKIIVSEDIAPEDSKFNSPEFHKKQHNL
ncbi:MAG: hypothetical protein IIB95_01155 [Candidatus Marinimicrobia bacterium]|nr:hypothetical protein [Candidatus Neomarinimicrobiota bacterium]MCH7762333.1 hypothetical protein [Candidatus Neomarinimicrobiota bacterium]